MSTWFQVEFGGGWTKDVELIAGPEHSDEVVRRARRLRRRAVLALVATPALVLVLIIVGSDLLGVWVNALIPALASAAAQWIVYLAIAQKRLVRLNRAIRLDNATVTALAVEVLAMPMLARITRLTVTCAALSAQERWQDALQRLRAEDFTTLAPFWQVFANVHRAQVLARRGGLHTALELARECAKTKERRHQVDLMARRTLASILVLAKHYGEAISLIDSMPNAGYADAYYDRGRALRGLGREAEALESFRRAVAEGADGKWAARAREALLRPAVPAPQDLGDVRAEAHAATP